MNEFKKSMVSALKEAMNREELNTRTTAKLLNLNPCYISMAMNEQNWPSMGKAPWARIEEWFRTEQTLAAFAIPEGETIWEKKPADFNIKEPDYVKKNKAADLKAPVIEKKKQSIPGVIDKEATVTVDKVDFSDGTTYEVTNHTPETGKKAEETTESNEAHSKTIDTIIEKTNRIRKEHNNKAVLAEASPVNNFAGKVAGHVETLELTAQNEPIKFSFEIDIRILVNGKPVS